jgi:membrane protease YdiL (CAAX protease family)
MNKGMLAYTKPGYRIILTISVSVTLGFITAMLAQAVLGNIYQFDLMNPEAEYDVADPEYAMVQRLVMLSTHLGMFVGASFAAAWLFASRNSVRRELGLRTLPSVQVLVLLPLLMFALTPVVNALYSLNLQWQAPAEVLEMEEKSMTLTESMLNTGNTGILLLNLLVLAIVPAIGEELLFRGLVQRYSIQWLKNIHAGIWVSAFIFSFVHFQFMGFLPRMILGAFFGYVTIWTGSLYASMLLHFINNATAVIISYLILNNGLDESLNEANTVHWYYLAGGLAIAVLMTWVIKKWSLGNAESYQTEVLTINEIKQED